MSHAPLAQHRGRIALLSLLLLFSAALYHWLSTVAPPSDGSPLLFLPVWSLCFLPYFAVCAFVLRSRPLEGRWRWVELLVLALGAVLFRVMLVPLPPGLSRDVWRYLWDARVVTHGYSPYVYAPGAKILEPLRNILFTNCRFRNIPTDYPPGAEGIFLLGYLLDPRGLAGIKAIFLLCDLITCGALAVLLARRGLDPRRAVIYAWCPLPIVEFAVEGHLDGAAIAVMMLSVLFATDTRRRARVLTGFFLAMATLIRLYPILLLPLLLRRRDWPLLLTVLATVALGYLPFALLGHGQVLGFLGAYTGQQGGNAGIVQAIVRRVAAGAGVPAVDVPNVEYATDAVLLAAVLAIILPAMRRGLISIELAAVVLFGVLFAMSSHVFPWYVTALLPWIACSTQPLHLERRSLARGVATGIAWYAACTCLFGYGQTVTRLGGAPWWAAVFYLGRGSLGIFAMAAAILLVYATLAFLAPKNFWAVVGSP